MEFAEFMQYCPHCGSEAFQINNFKSKKCKQCNFSFYMNASAAVAAFVLNENGELLVCKRAKDPEAGTLDLPGGFVDYDETAEQAIARELSEELNARVISTKYLFSLPNSYLYSGLTIPTLDLFFECKLENYNTLKAADDVADYKFVKPNLLNPDDFGLKSIRNAVSEFKLRNNEPNF